MQPTNNSINDYSDQWQQNIHTGNKNGNMAIVDQLIDDNRNGKIGQLEVTDFLFQVAAQDDPEIMAKLKQKSLSTGLEEGKTLIPLGTALCEHCLKKYQAQYDQNLAAGNITENRTIIDKLIDANLGIPPKLVVKFLVDNKINPDSIADFAARFESAKGCKFQPLYSKAQKFQELKEYVEKKYAAEKGLKEFSACNSVEELDTNYAPIMFAIMQKDLVLIDKLIELGGNKNKTVSEKKYYFSPILLAIDCQMPLAELTKRGIIADVKTIEILSKKDPARFEETYALFVNAVEQLGKTNQSHNYLLDSLSLLNKDYVNSKIKDYILQHVELPLHFLAAKNEFDIKEIASLVKRGVSVDLKDKIGNNALATYCMRANPSKQAVDQMIQLGFDLHTKNNEGLSAAQTLLNKSSGAFNDKTWYTLDTLKTYFDENESELKACASLMPSLNLNLQGQAEIIRYLVENEAEVDNNFLARIQNQLKQNDVMLEKLDESSPNQHSLIKTPALKAKNEKLKALAELLPTLLIEQTLAKNATDYAALARDSQGLLTEAASLQANILLWELINLPNLSGPALFDALTEHGVDAGDHTMFWEGASTKKAKAIEEKFGMPIAAFFEFKGDAASYVRDNQIDEIVATQREHYMQSEQQDALSCFEIAFNTLPKEGSFVVIHALPNNEGGVATSPVALTQEELSYRCGFGSKSWRGYYNKSDMQKNVEAFLARPENGAHAGFIWVNTFSNVNTSVPNYEKEAIALINPLNPAGPLVIFPNPEFYYQYCKLAYFVNKMPAGPEKNSWIKSLQDAIVEADYQDPKNAYGFGQQKVPGYSADEWKKDGKDMLVMRSCLHAKFTQNPLLLAELVLTAKDSRPLVQMKSDGYWGSGDNGRGLNGLGKCLMEVRDDIIAGKKPPLFELQRQH